MSQYGITQDNYFKLLTLGLEPHDLTDGALYLLVECYDNYCCVSKVRPKAITEYSVEFYYYNRQGRITGDEMHCELEENELSNFTYDDALKEHNHSWYHIRVV